MNPATSEPAPRQEPPAAPGLAGRVMRLLGSAPTAQRSLGQRLAHGAIWSLLGAAISRGLALLASIVAARLLGKERFGELGIVQTTVAMFQVFADFGLSVTATKFVAQYRSTQPDRAGRIAGLSNLFALVFGGTMALALVVGAPLLARHALGAPHLTSLLRLSGALLFFTALNGAQVGALSGLEAFRAIARVNLISGVLSFPLLIVGVALDGVRGAVLGLGAGMAVTWLLNQRALASEARLQGVRVTMRGCLAERAVLVGFSLPAALAALAMSPVQWAAQALLVNQPGGLAQLGVFNAVLRIKQAPESVLANLVRPLLPVLSEQFGRKDSAAYGKTLTSAYVLCCAVIVPFAIVVAGAPGLALWPFGADFAGHHGLVQWLMVHGAVVALGTPLASILASRGAMWLALAFNGSWALCYLALSVGLVPLHRGSGLAAAMAIAQVLATAPMIVFLATRHRSYQGGFPAVAMMGLVPTAVGGGAAASWFLPPAGALGLSAGLAAGLCVFLYRVVSSSRRAATRERS